MKVLAALTLALSLALVPFPAFAADAVSAASNFSSLMQSVGTAMAVGLGVLSALLLAIGLLAGNPKVVGSGKMGFIGVAILMIATTVVGFVSSTIGKVIS